MFSKQPLTISQQVELLKSRGMIIESGDNADFTLTQISYYRLAGYWWPMQSDKINHIFKPNSRFADALALYNLDHELRLLIFDAIEKIEISLRTKLIYHLSHEFDPWWFQKTELFNDIGSLIQTLSTIGDEVNRSKDAFIQEHKKKHKDDLRFPPAWKTLELTSFGNLSKLYGDLKNTILSKDKIAAEFGTVNHTFLPSWLQSISQIRNYCAHHSRLWNRNLPGRPKLLKNPPYPWITKVPGDGHFQMLYIHVCCMRYLLNTIQPGNQFSLNFSNLLRRYPNVDPAALGLVAGWENEPLWEVQ